MNKPISIKRVVAEDNAINVLENDVIDYCSCSSTSKMLPYSENTMKDPSIPDFFAGQVIFMTGGSGFMGKVLIEKILRSCPLVAKIYVLMRAKKGMDIEERMTKIFSGPLYERLREERPGIIEEKVVAIQGDVIELGLGLSESDHKLLVENVTLIYHVAATVRFDQPLKEAILINTRGTVEACKLALECKRLKLFLHVSTAYCHCDRKVIEEKIYPPHADWRKCIEIAEQIDEFELEKVAAIFMNGFPNTYTFSKSLAESAVYDLLNNKMANIILRPSIVVSTKDEPIKGWLDNFNGPVGLFAACGTGLVRISFTGNIRADFVPVDSVIKGIIIITWVATTKSEYKECKETLVFNASTHNVQYVMIDEVIEMAIGNAWTCPLEKCVWYPTTKKTSNLFIYYLYLYLFHLIPGLFIDGMLKLMNYPPLVLRLHRKVHIASMALKYFTTNTWSIINTTTYNMELFLQPQDIQAFSYEAIGANPNIVFKNYMQGAKKYLLKEDLENTSKAIIRYRTFYYLDLFVSVASYCLFFYVLHFKLDAFNYVYGCVERYIANL